MIEFTKTCEVCGCYSGTHGGCEERGHDKRCHGYHTMFFCDCDCCPCEDTTKIKETT